MRIVDMGYVKGAEASVLQEGQNLTQVRTKKVGKALLEVHTRKNEQMQLLPHRCVQPETARPPTETWGD